MNLKDVQVCLDLDSTCIYSISKGEKPRGSDYFEMYCGESYIVHKRPYIGEFLNYCLNNLGSVNVWTAADSRYAKEIVKGLFGSRYKDVLFWHRDNCEGILTPDESYPYYKPLHKLIDTYPEKYNIRNTFIVDDVSETGRKNMFNLVNIKPFKGSNEDNELLKIMAVLEEFKTGFNDVRELVSVINANIE